MNRAEEGGSGDATGGHPAYTAKLNKNKNLFIPVQIAKLKVKLQSQLQSH